MNITVLSSRVKLMRIDSFQWIKQMKVHSIITLTTLNKKVKKQVDNSTPIKPGVFKKEEGKDDKRIRVFKGNLWKFK